MPRYLALIYGDESQAGGMSEEDMGQMMKEYGEYTQTVQSAGVMAGGDALEPTSTATTVRTRNGEISTTDGPFAETKEQLGGYYVFNVKDLDEAIEWASKIPGAKYGSIEVRPIWEIPGQ